MIIIIIITAQSRKNFFYKYPSKKKKFCVRAPISKIGRTDGRTYGRKIQTKYLVPIYTCTWTNTEPSENTRNGYKQTQTHAPNPILILTVLLLESDKTDYLTRWLRVFNFQVRDRRRGFIYNFRFGSLAKNQRSTVFFFIFWHGKSFARTPPPHYPHLLYSIRDMIIID